MYRFTEWPYLIVKKPNAARNELVKAFHATNSIVGAAKLLGLSRRSFYSYMKKLNITYEYLMIESARRPQ